MGSKVEKMKKARSQIKAAVVTVSQNSIINEKVGQAIIRHFYRGISGYEATAAEVVQAALCIAHSEMNLMLEAIDKTINKLEEEARFE